MEALHTPERLSGESFEDYKARRSASNEAVRNLQRDPNHGLVGARKKLRDSMRLSGAMGYRMRAYKALMAATASKRVTKAKLRDEHGAYTLVGKDTRGYEYVEGTAVGMSGRPRRMWLAGISAQRGY